MNTLFVNKRNYSWFRSKPRFWYNTYFCKVPLFACSKSCTWIMHSNILVVHNFTFFGNRTYVRSKVYAILIVIWIFMQSIFIRLFLCLVLSGKVRRKSIYLVNNRLHNFFLLFPFHLYVQNKWINTWKKIFLRIDWHKTSLK